ncbi:LysR family transcriptional regulator [Schumannella soli]|uniref:LysR family transcriptional regulator n=1 Tax=Schumannella soli TaxID=2590779 RepID=A0A506YBW7_9MICO|nr:LysR family transcriptional regulator [Schumannella soli]TPW77919.1 LysR family transcriptional regulator [Schumannella soli]
MSDRVDLPALRLFADVLRLGSLGAAARESGVTQQAASARIRSLERTIGIELLVRGASGSEPTEAGRLFATWAADVLAAADRLDSGVRALRESDRRHLAFAASQTVAEHLAPGWLVALRRATDAAGAAPVEVRLTVGNSEAVAELVRSRAVELGVIESPDLPADLAAVPLGHDALVPVVAPDHPWASRTAPLDLAELAATPLAVREQGSGTRRALERLLAERGAGAPVAPAMELDTSAAVRSAAAAGIAPAVLSELAVADDIRLGRLVRIPLAGAPLHREFTAIWRGDATQPSPAAEALLRVIGRESRAGGADA